MQRFWDASGFTACLSKTVYPASSQDSTVDGNRWRELYRAAILELDPELLQARVKAAEDAIHARASLNGDIPSDERIAMQDALSALIIPETRAGLIARRLVFPFDCLGDELAARCCLANRKQQVSIHATFQYVSQSSQVHAGMHEVAV